MTSDVLGGWAMKDSEKITIRLPERYLRGLDALVSLDDFENRSEAIRHAVRDLLYARLDLVEDRVQKMHQLDQKLERLAHLEREVMKP